MSKEGAALKQTRKCKQLCLSIPEALREKIREKKTTEGYKSEAAVVCRLLTTHPEMQTA